MVPGCGTYIAHGDRDAGITEVYACVNGNGCHQEYRKQRILSTIIVIDMHDFKCSLGITKWFMHGCWCLSVLHQTRRVYTLHKA